LITALLDLDPELELELTPMGGVAWYSHPYQSECGTAQTAPFKLISTRQIVGAGHHIRLDDMGATIITAANQPLNHSYMAGDGRSWTLL